MAATPSSDIVETTSEERDKAAALCVLRDNQNSLDLCLYGLIGLALCRSGHWVKRPSIDCMAQWHDEFWRPGHSLRLALDTPAVHNIVQRHKPRRDPLSRSRLITVAALLRQSQFAAHARAFRGPPS